MKKILSILLLISVILIVTSCELYRNNEELKDRGDTEATNIVVLETNPIVKDSMEDLDLELLISLLNLNKEDVLNRINKSFEIIQSGPEGAYDGYYFEELGLNIIFNDENSIDYLELTEISEMKIGTTFKEVMTVYGDSKIREVKYKVDNITEVTEYDLDFIIEGHILRFTSDSDKYTVDRITLYGNDYSDYYISKVND